MSCLCRTGRIPTVDVTLFKCNVWGFSVYILLCINSFNTMTSPFQWNGHKGHMCVYGLEKMQPGAHQPQAWW